MLYTGSAISQSTNASISRRAFFVEVAASRSRNAAGSIWRSAPLREASTSPTRTMMSKPMTSATVAPSMVPKICFRNPTYVSRSSDREKNRDAGPPRKSPFPRERMYASTYAAMTRSVSDSVSDVFFFFVSEEAATSEAATFSSEAASLAAASMTVSATAASLARRRNSSGSPRNTNSAVPTVSLASAHATLATSFSNCGNRRETGGAFSSSRTNLRSASSLSSAFVPESLHPFSASEMVSEYVKPNRRAEKLFSASSAT